ncbi:MAG: TadE/TadG family type IV pilus assembly protein [Kiloniellales bacterium]
MLAQILAACRCRAGNVSLEVAFVVTVLLVLAVGAVDFGRYGLAHLTLSSAARAGAQYGIQSQASAGETAMIEQAARHDSGNPSLDVAVRQFCECPGAGEVDCGITCADDDYAMMYVEVTTRDELELFFDYPGVESPMPLTARSRMRVR